MTILAGVRKRRPLIEDGCREIGAPLPNGRIGALVAFDAEPRRRLIVAGIGITTMLPETASVPPRGRARGIHVHLEFIKARVSRSC
jgi:hypothetical protein